MKVTTDVPSVRHASTAPDVQIAKLPEDLSLKQSAEAMIEAVEDYIQDMDFLTPDMTDILEHVDTVVRVGGVARERILELTIEAFESDAKSKREVENAHQMATLAVQILRYCKHGQIGTAFLMPGKGPSSAEMDMLATNLKEKMLRYQGRVRQCPLLGVHSTETRDFHARMSADVAKAVRAHTQAITSKHSCEHVKREAKAMMEQAKRVLSTFHLE